MPLLSPDQQYAVLWHCWSGCPSYHPTNSTQCCGTVGRDALLSPDQQYAVLWHCWSGCPFYHPTNSTQCSGTVGRDAPPVARPTVHSAVALLVRMPLLSPDQQYALLWHCWSGCPSCHPTNNMQCSGTVALLALLIGMPLLSPDQQCQSTERTFSLIICFSLGCSLNVA